ncbi:MAG: Phosphoribosylaminoimidazole-succinocarboxamide synthase [Verrucomicrobiae bacterium]|nr:Phosphoribosylaminoimidazole-succinocarboxamide synthase [Verrucomicrobiae bacterium]
MTSALSNIDVPGLKKVRSGKVREIFDLNDALLFVASDRISAFDVIMPDPIPEKGRVLTAFSEFWFGKAKHIVENHFITSDYAAIAKRVGNHEQLRGRAMLVRKCQPLPVECIVRGYLAGSGWKEYKKSQTVCSQKLPAGLVESSELPEPIFTPSTKAATGHDENISFARASEILGKPLADKVSAYSIALYKFARDYARHRGIIIADTKFEFGLEGDKVILIDEALTPDSSRFWPAATYKPGGPQPSFDKQFLRDYLETLTWDKTPPGPKLPAEIIRKTSEKYLEALQRLTA